MLAKRDYRYDAQQDCYHCPHNEILRYQTTNGDGCRLYASDPDKCRECPLRAQCTKSKSGIKQVSRHVWQGDRERIDQNRLTDPGKQIYKGRQETVERSFADAKQHHGHRYARYRGLAKVQMQGLLAVACQHMKKIALVQSRKGSKGTNPANPSQRVFGGR